MEYKKIQCPKCGSYNTNLEGISDNDMRKIYCKNCKRSSITTVHVNELPRLRGGVTHVDRVVKKYNALSDSEKIEFKKILCI